MSVFLHGKRWWYDFRFRGVRYQERTPAATRDAALQIEATRRAELAAAHTGSPIEKRSPSFAHFAYGDFSRWCAIEHQDRPSTYARYMRSIKVLAAFLGHHTLRAINAGLVSSTKCIAASRSASTPATAALSHRPP